MVVINCSAAMLQIGFANQLVQAIAFAAPLGIYKQSRIVLQIQGLLSPDRKVAADTLPPWRIGACHGLLRVAPFIICASSVVVKSQTLQILPACCHSPQF